jgi:4-amino-4-deoxy-L-arabinose transferase-like glycosyltransferase
MVRLTTTFRGRLAAIVAGGLCLRLLYVLVLARHVPMAGDSIYFHTEPKLIASGHGFINPFVFAANHRTIATAAHPPLYPILLSVPALIGIDGTLAQRAFTCLVGAVVLTMIGLLGRRIGGERVGLLSAALASIYPVLVTADGALMSESLYGLVVTWALLAALRQRECHDLRSAVALGAAAGFAALTRAEALLLLPLLAWPLALKGRERRLVRLAASTLACMLVVAPWLIRNFHVWHELTISHNDSTVLAGANCQSSYYGPQLGGWDFFCISKTVTLNEGQQAAIWRRQGLHYLEHHLDRLPVVLAVRLLRSWDFYEPRRQESFAEGRAQWADEAGIAVYYLLLPIAVYGAVLLWRRSPGELWVLVVPALLVTVVTLISWGLPRFRHAAEPSIVVLASYAMVSVVVRRRRLAVRV